MNEYKELKCVNCDSLIEHDDNFCYNCGHFTAKGYMYLKNESNVKNIEKGYVYKQDNKFRTLLFLTFLLFTIFTFSTIVKGNDFFKPFILIKKQVTSYLYGYNSSIMKTNNIYKEQYINTINDGKNIIKQDFNNQKWQCLNNPNVSILEQNLEKKYNITSVSFCDINEEEAKKISNVIQKMYELFPNIDGSLTNITITNANTKTEYIAYFQPLYQFVNNNEDINKYNKVNKTQILLNSYYFLNNDIISTPIEDVVGKNWYVNGATWESTIAHELGHYITFKTLLKENNLDNIILETKDNEKIIDNIIQKFDNGSFSFLIVNEALNNYNKKYNKNILIDEFALLISNYAGMKDTNGKLICDETIAEAIHDYYLNGDNCSLESKEIINIIKIKLGSV